MHAENIALKDDAGSDLAVLDRPEQPDEQGADAGLASAERQCDPREVHMAIGTLFVRAWARRVL